MSEKRKPAIRQRPIQVKFFVDEKELSLIKARMAQLGIENMSAYLRKMAIDGYAAKPDLLNVVSQKTLTYFPRWSDVQLRRSAVDFSEIVQGFGGISPTRLHGCINTSIAC